jgi:hypothetical protein
LQSTGPGVVVLHDGSFGLVLQSIGPIGGGTVELEHSGAVDPCSHVGGGGGGSTVGGGSSTGGGGGFGSSVFRSLSPPVLPLPPLSLLPHCFLLHLHHYYRLHRYHRY